MTRQFRYELLSCAALVLIMPTAAYAQATQSDEVAPASPDTVETRAQAQDDPIVVTGSRIRENGFKAPVPVTVLGQAEINAQKPANITDLVYTLPAVSTGANNSQSGSGAGNQSFGVNTINLRGLGSNRTLVLLDGHRTVASSFDGEVDVSTFPQELIERVEIVTGGASAQYGSDAVGGVINFILDHDFTGIKLGADAGITTYGDGFNHRFTATAGGSFLDDRLHVLMNGEYFHQDGIGRKTADRPWDNAGFEMLRNPAYAVDANGQGNGQPEYIVASNVGTNYTRGGVISSGPLMGTNFLGDGVTNQIDYGTFSSRSLPFFIGGDWQETLNGELASNSLMPTERRIGLFNRTTFDLTPNVSIYGQFSWNQYRGSINNGENWFDYPVQDDNAYLLTQYPEVAAAMQSNGITSFNLGGAYANLPLFTLKGKRNVYRYSAGADGKFSLFGRSWSWDLYFQHGVVKTHESKPGDWNGPNFFLAQDAVLSNGQIVCRSTLTDPTDGCVPLDILGTDPISAESLAYIFEGGDPFRKSTIKQDVAALTFSGQLFDLPGGPAAVAFGGEWRKDKLSSDVGGNPGTYSNFKPNRGKINVKEAFLEIALPVFAGFSLDAAGRYTDYSTSGSAKTWKVGATYEPIPDIKFRSAYSHDIRAPNMQELFLTGGAPLQHVELPENSPQPGNFFVQGISGGNPNLAPEKANTWTAGVVLSPRFLPGLSGSVDYWNIKIKDAIGTVSAQQTIDFCYGGDPTFCDRVLFTNGQFSGVSVQPINFASQHATGIDFELGYRTPLSKIAPKLPGDFRIHAAVSHKIKNVVDNLVFPIDYAGVIANLAQGTNNASPSWVYRVSANYDIDPVSFNLVARGFNSGVYANAWIECTSNCPTSTVQRRTINNNRIPGALYFDGSVRWKLRPAGTETELNFIVKNIFNKSPAPFGLNVSGDLVAYPAAARPLYDTLGRVYRVALTTKF